MRINFKQPKYILPLVLLPFLCLFFSVYRSGTRAGKNKTTTPAGFNSSVGDVSAQVQKKGLADKLDAFRNSYKQGDGNTVVNAIPTDQDAQPSPTVGGDNVQTSKLDSLRHAMNLRFNSSPATPVSSQDKDLASALNDFTARKTIASAPSPPPKEKDPMELFKQQMAYMDSMRRESDPAYRAEKQKQQALAAAAASKMKEKTLSVMKSASPPGEFNTLLPEKQADFITAEIDENITGYQGSRVRLRLLDEIKAGNNTIPKGTYLYALISGFTTQRVNLSIKTILCNGQLLPVKLEIYDQDGLAGLYVPDSRFRDFTRDLGAGTAQGASTITSSGNGQLLVSEAGKLVESASTAVGSAIRKNKVNIKYNSFVYLIDTKNLNQ
jgi:conjugative transposon TraM protein